MQNARARARASSQKQPHRRRPRPAASRPRRRTAALLAVRADRRREAAARRRVEVLAHRVLTALAGLMGRLLEVEAVGGRARDRRARRRREQLAAAPQGGRRRLGGLRCRSRRCCHCRDGEGKQREQQQGLRQSGGGAAAVAVMPLLLVCRRSPRASRQQHGAEAAAAATRIRRTPRAHAIMPGRLRHRVARDVCALYRSMTWCVVGLASARGERRGRGQVGVDGPRAKNSIPNRETCRNPALYSHNAQNTDNDVPCDRTGPVSLAPRLL